MQKFIEKAKIILKKVWQFLANPHFLICFGLAWIITNGWAYILAAIGALTKTPWMIAVSGTYLTLLWFPFTPEKIVTIGISFFLLKKLFPDDKKTLKVLMDLKDNIVGKVKDKEAERKEKKEQKEDKEK